MRGWRRGGDKSSLPVNREAELSAGGPEKSPKISSKLGCCCCCDDVDVVVPGTEELPLVVPKVAAAPRSTSFEGLEDFLDEAD